VNLRFLCARHRAWLEQEPGAAQTIWLRAYDTAQCLRASGEAEQALRHAGAAVEAATVALRRDQDEIANALDRFVDSSLLFLLLLEDVRQQGVARSFLGSAIQQLSDLMAEGAPRGPVLQACQRLTAMNEPATTMTAAAEVPTPRSYHLH
jgi:hypothetical protein